jgi:hypothetical protein
MKLGRTITAAAKEADLDYSTASEMERIGGNVISLSPTEWKALATN